MLLWIIGVAFAGRTVELEWMADPIVKEKSECSTDVECSAALSAMKSSVRSEAKRQAKSSDICSDMESSLNASSSSVKSVSIREMNPVPSGYEITWHITGKVTCEFFE
jgi:hypothetical protein